MDAHQVKAVELIKNGHNLVITGQDGTGKTHLIKHVTQILSGSQVRVTCYTGMACQQYPAACTLHKFAGLEDGRFN